MKAYMEANKEKRKAYFKTYFEANKEKKKAYDKSWRENNRDKMKAYMEANKEKRKVQMKAYMEANKEKRKAYREANKEKVIAWSKAYREAHKGQVTAGVRAYQANKKQKDCITTKEDKQLARWVYSQSTKLSETTDIKWEVDHIKPLSKGGMHSLDNLQIVPMQWNRTKKNNNEKRWNGLL